MSQKMRLTSSYRSPPTLVPYPHPQVYFPGSSPKGVWGSKIVLLFFGLRGRLEAAGDLGLGLGRPQKLPLTYPDPLTPTPTPPDPI